MTAIVEAPPVTPSDKRVAALAHLGIPLWGPILPLILKGVSKESPFRTTHAETAIAYQFTFLGIWVVLNVLTTILQVLPYSALIVVLGVGFVGELPQMARALSGKEPVRVVTP